MNINEDLNINGMGKNIESSDLITNEFLNSYNLTINQKYNLLICRTCKYVIEKEYAFYHVSNNHRMIVDSKLLKQDQKNLFFEKLNLMDPLLNNNANNNFESEAVLEGLNLYEGYICLTCNYLGRSKKGLYNHSKEKHNGLMSFENCFIQTLFLNPEKRKYFRVKKSSNDSFQGREVEEGENNEIFGITRTLNS